MVIRRFAPAKISLARPFVRRQKASPRVGESSLAGERKLSYLSILFAFRLVLTACFGFSGTFIHERRNKGSFLIHVDNQSVTMGRFCQRRKRSTIKAQETDKPRIEKRQNRHGKAPKTTCRFSRQPTLRRPTRHRMSNNTPFLIARRPSPQYKIMSRFFRLFVEEEQKHKATPRNTNMR